MKNLTGIAAGVAFILLIILASCLVITKASGQTHTNIGVEYYHSSVAQNHFYEVNTTSNWQGYGLTARDGWVSIHAGKSSMDIQNFHPFASEQFKAQRSYWVFGIGLDVPLLHRYPITVEVPIHLRAHAVRDAPAIFQTFTGVSVRGPNHWPVQFSIDGGFNGHSNPISGVSVPGGHITKSRFEIGFSPYIRVRVLKTLLGSHTDIVVPGCKL